MIAVKPVKRISWKQYAQESLCRGMNSQPRPPTPLRRKESVMNWTATYGKVAEITENDEGYDWDFDGVQLYWEPSHEN